MQEGKPNEQQDRRWLVIIIINNNKIRAGGGFCWENTANTWANFENNEQEMHTYLRMLEEDIFQ